MSAQTLAAARQQAKQYAARSLLRGVPHFAWWPVRLDSGRWLWLQRCFLKTLGWQESTGVYCADRRTAHYSRQQTPLLLVPRWDQDSPRLNAARAAELKRAKNK